MLLVVWRSPAECFVECGAVIVLMDMDQFMQDQIVNPLWWQQDYPPVKEHLAFVGA